MESNITYSLFLNKSQADYLSTSKYGFNRMHALVSLIDLTNTTEEEYKIKGVSVTIHVGQIVPQKLNCPVSGSATAKLYQES